MNQQDVFKSSLRLHLQGFSIIWLKPRSKMPIGLGWTKAKNKDWKELEREYVTNCNVGVRLGEPSKLSDGSYLAVIDCDVKSSDPAAEKEMLKALGEIFPHWAEAPIVLSGRGGGSKHIYVKTATPVNTQLIKRSMHKAPVKMPSVQPSKTDLLGLTPDQIQEGYRIRAAWEIELIGTGGQVVLPPSIHPDTNLPYTWLSNREPISADFIPLWEGDVKKTKASKEKLIKYKPIDVDILSRPLSPDLIRLISDAETESSVNGDRSAMIWLAACGLISAGFNITETISVLSNPDYAISEKAWEARLGGTREAAIRWLTPQVEKAWKENGPQSAFTAIEPWEAVDAEGSIKVAEDGWKSLLDRNQYGALKSTFRNVKEIIDHSCPSSAIRYNEFFKTIVLAPLPPWNPEQTHQKEFEDIDAIAIKFWIADHWGFEASIGTVFEAVQYVASTRPFHPVRDYLEKLEWDGVSRLDKLLTNVFGADDTLYTSQIGIKTLVAAVTRVYEPGTKFDQVLVLEGDQGIGKSTALSILASPQFFSDSLGNITSKDAVDAIQRCWIVELGEMSSASKAEVNELKEFLSRQVDRVRPAYGRATINFPRHCIFIGTTNQDEYLRDETGNRRFWPVYVRKADNYYLRQNRDQIWAEAVFKYRMGEELYISDMEVRKIEKEEQAARFAKDTLADEISLLIDRDDELKGEGFTVNQVLSKLHALKVNYDYPRSDQMRVTACLKFLGYKQERVWIEGKVFRLWKKRETKKEA